MEVDVAVDKKSPPTSIPVWTSHKNEHFNAMTRFYLLTYLFD